MFALSVALSIVSITVVGVSQASLVKCGYTRGDTVDDQKFDAGWSKLAARIYCDKDGNARWCTFYTATNAPYPDPLKMSPDVGERRKHCGADNAYTCICDKGNSNTEAIPRITFG